MGSLDSIKLRQAMAVEHSERIASDGSVALRLKYTSTGSVTSVTVTTATNIVLITSDGGTETFTFATYDTMGKLAEAINNSAYWSCKLVDALRADATASKLVDGAITVSSAGFYDATIDTSVFKAITYRCTFDRFPDGAHNSSKPKGSHRVHLREIRYLADVNAASANGVRVYETDPKTNAETQVYQTDSVDNSATTIQFASGEGVISSQDGNDLVVRIIDGTSMSDTGLYLEASYKAE